MAAKVKTWVWIIVGVVAVCFLLVVAMAAAGFYFFSQHFNTKVVSNVTAAQEFDGVRRQFAGQKALIELDEHGQFLRANTDRTINLEAKKPDQLYVLVYDPDDQRVVKVAIPFWLLRFKKGNGTVDFNGGRLDLEDLKLTVEDLERFGPTLIVDHQETSGDRVLVWSQ
jgi:hypothetical protein